MRLANVSRCTDGDSVASGTHSPFSSLQSSPHVGGNGHCFVCGMYGITNKPHHFKPGKPVTSYTPDGLTFMLETSERTTTNGLRFPERLDERQNDMYILILIARVSTLHRILYPLLQNPIVTRLAITCAPLGVLVLLCRFPKKVLFLPLLGDAV